MADSALKLPHQQRVAAEWIDLVKKIEALESFMATTAFAVLHAQERLLMADQKDAMLDYSRALAGRLDFWGADLVVLRRGAADA